MAFSLLKRGLWAVAGRSRPEGRFKGHFKAKIYDQSGWMRVRGVDMHAEGALVMASKPLAPQSPVFVHLKSFGLMGFGQVRHCTKRGPWRYAIGVGFPAPLI